MAQPVPQGPYSPGPDNFGPNYPSDIPNPDYPNSVGYPSGPDYSPSPGYPSYPNNPSVPESITRSSGGEDHPIEGPSSSEPLSTPSASNTEALSYVEGQSLTQQEVSASGGMESRTMAYMMVTGLQIWTRYNGMWTTNPAAVYYWRSTSILSYNDQAQTVWFWERYPNGQTSWHNLGYRMPGYFHGRFIGDARGWHELAMWGSRSGWSNVVWIYVW